MIRTVLCQPKTWNNLIITQYYYPGYSLLPRILWILDWTGTKFRTLEFYFIYTIIIIILHNQLYKNNEHKFFYNYISTSKLSSKGQLAPYVMQFDIVILVAMRKCNVWINSSQTNIFRNFCFENVIRLE
jgi:hypothetical protein